MNKNNIINIIKKINDIKLFFYMDSNFANSSNSNENKTLNSKYCSDISKINSQLESENGNTPLILSLLSKDIESFTELLSLGTSPNISNYSGEPLCIYRYQTIIRILLFFY